MPVNAQKNKSLADLRKALVDLLPDRADILFVIQGSGLNQGRIELGGRADGNWFSLLGEADRRNRVGKVIQAVVDEVNDKPVAVLEAYRDYLLAVQQTDELGLLTESPSTDSSPTGAPMSHSSDELRREVTDLIGQNKLVEALDLLDKYLSNYLYANQRDLSNELILHKRQYVSLLSEERQGLLTREEVRVEHAQLSNRLLQFLQIVSVPAHTQLVAEQTPLVQAESAISPNLSTFQQLMGVNNLKNLSWMGKGVRAADAVCRILTPNGGYGTGFLIAPGLLMTNCHVIRNKTVAAGSVVEFNYQEGDDGKLLQTVRYPLDPTRFHCSAEDKLDYTIVGVREVADAPPLEQWGILALNPHANPVAGERITIIQHPNGGLKQIVLRGNEVIRTWGHRLQYTADTLKGSSGSPVFNDQWQVVAIHHRGGDLPVNDHGDIRTVNQGILMAAIKPDAGDYWPF